MAPPRASALPPGLALQQQLDVLRTMLQTPRTPPPTASRTLASSLPSTQGAAPLSEVVAWLSAEVCRRVGITLNGSLRSKLEKIAEAQPPGKLGQWIERLAGLDSSDPEWLSFVEMLTVHETYFMRDPGQFDFVRRQAMAKVIAGQKDRTRPALRLWSAACSTGEEAYSLAMLAVDTLAAAGEAVIDAVGHVRYLRPWVIEVVGSDLSRQALRTAEAAIYQEFGLGPFRNLPQYCWRFFERTGRGDSPIEGGSIWQVHPDIRRLVRFQQFNLLNSNPPVEQVDIVFCRNVLIYFDANGRRRVFKLIHSLLNTDGFAVFGPTDVPDDPHLFKAHWGPSTVIYQKT
jgi:chemotaxis protein methyltransferase CheR